MDYIIRIKKIGLLSSRPKSVFHGRTWNYLILIVFINILEFFIVRLLSDQKMLEFDLVEKYLINSGMTIAFGVS